MHGDVLDLVEQRPAGREAGLDEVGDDPVLAVDRDRAAAGQLAHRDPVAPSREAELDAVMDEALRLDAAGEAGLPEHVHGALLEHARPHPLLDVLAAAVLEHDGLDALEAEQVGEQEPGRPCADDPDLGAHHPRRS